MIDVGIAKMSSKGQIVIPFEMRGDIKEGDKVILIKNDNQIIMKKAEYFGENLADDLEFAKRTEAAIRRHEKGKFMSLEKEDFLKELKKW